MKVQFNINNIVRVKLTDYGRSVHAADYVLFWASVNHPNHPAYAAPKEDNNGWSEWQLWSLMQAFGKHINLGFGKVCFETTIELTIPLQNV